MYETTRPAIFLDRDGVINENRDDYVKSWEEVFFLAGIFPALQRLQQSAYRVVLVTNQSAVGRGIITAQQALAVNRRVVETIEAWGGRIDASYLCQHQPDDGCDCRKPAPGMLLQAARDLNLDLARSYLIGDAMSDLQAAKAAGVQGILVLTGRGLQELRRSAATDALRWLVAADLAGALAYIPGLPKARDWAAAPDHALASRPFDGLAGEAR